MNTDVKTLLTRALDEGQPADAMVDPGHDLRRIHRRIQRRRTVLASGVGATLLIAALVPAAAFNLSHGDTDRNVAESPTADLNPSRSISLVGYHGTQAEAFALAWVPSGWTIVASDTTSVVVAPVRNADPDPQMVDDKIEIEALSDDVDPRHGRRTVFKIDGREGYLVEGQALTYQAAIGRWIHIQLPDALRDWTPTQIRTFAEGITVGKNLGHRGG